MSRFLHLELNIVHHLKRKSYIHLEIVRNVHYKLISVLRAEISLVMLYWPRQGDSCHFYHKKDTAQSHERESGSFCMGWA